MSAEWIPISVYAKEAKDYLNAYWNGQTRSLKTPWDVLNNELLKGLSWNTVIQLVGGSGSGKTAVQQQLVDGLLTLNPDEPLDILDFQFEMPGKQMALRSAVRTMDFSMKKLQLGEDLTPADKRRVMDYFDNTLSHKNIYTIDIPCSVEAIEEAIDAFYKAHPNREMVASIDHSILVPRNANEKDDWATIRRLQEMLIRTKKRYPIIWIVLNQMGRDFDSTLRQVPNSMSAFPTKKDIYGGDGLFFCSDLVIAINKPYQSLPINSWYGPQSYGLRVTDELMVWHILKNRIGEPNVLIPMKSNLEFMRVIDPSMANGGRPLRVGDQLPIFSSLTMTR